jgi:hypothetical protein
VLDGDAYAALVVVIIVMAFVTSVTLKRSLAREAASSNS